MVPFLEQILVYEPLDVIGVAFGFIGFLTISMLMHMPNSERSKLFYFVLIVITALSATFYIASDTFYKVKQSPTRGPVHWHADFRVFKCGLELDIIDPSGISNRVGTPVIHEHGDKRIHIEGLIINLEEASLGNFFHVIGGEFTGTQFVVPTNLGPVKMQNGELCPGASVPSENQAFLWQLDGGVARQRKLVDAESYVFSPEDRIPPGDCVIFEFASPTERTTHICEQYEVAALRGDITIEK